MSTDVETEPVVTYTLSLTVTRPVRGDDDNSSLAEIAQWMAGPKAQRELEREVLQALRKLDGDCDVEVMQAQHDVGVKQ